MWKLLTNTKISLQFSLRFLTIGMIRAASWLGTRATPHSEQSPSEKSTFTMVLLRSAWIINNQSSAPRPTTRCTLPFKGECILFCQGLSSFYVRVNPGASGRSTFEGGKKGCSRRAFLRWSIMSSTSVGWLVCWCRRVPKIAILIFCANISLLNYEHNHKLTKRRENTAWTREGANQWSAARRNLYAASFYPKNRTRKWNCSVWKRGSSVQKITIRLG